MTTSQKRVCVVGAGPSGLSVLFHFANLVNGNDVKVVCFEKQSTWEGMWTYSGHLDSDDHGKSTAHQRRSNQGEYAQHQPYMFEDCFGKAPHSIPAKLALRDYLEGRWKSSVDLDKFIKPHTLVRYVQFNESKDDFSVTSTNLVSNETTIETFTHVIVATGIFNVPIVPSFPGIETFQGRILYAHSLHGAAEVKDQRLLIVGAPYSVEALAAKCLTYGAKTVICTCRTKQAGFRLANGIEQRPYLQKFDGNVAYFKDRTIAEVDCLMIGTGYLYSYRFMEDRLRLKSSPSFYAENLYKGSVWMGGANNKLFYLGTQDRLYSLTLFDAQGVWVCKYILGKLPDEPKSTYEMRRNVKEWVRMSSRAISLKDYVNFLKDFISDLSKDFGHPIHASTAEITKHTWSRFRPEEDNSYRDRRRLASYPSDNLHRPFVRFHSVPEDKMY